MSLRMTLSYRNQIARTTLAIKRASHNARLSIPLSSRRFYYNSPDNDDNNNNKTEFSNNDGLDPDRHERLRTALVVGSSGATGAILARTLSQELGMKVIGADVMELPSDFDLDWGLDGFVPLPSTGGGEGRKEDQEEEEPEASSLPFITELTRQLLRGVQDHLLLSSQEQQQTVVTHSFRQQQQPSHPLVLLDAIIVAAGGWQGDPVDMPSSPSTDGSFADEFLRMEEGAVAYATTIDTMLRMNLYPVVAASYVAQHYMNPHGLFVSIGATAALGPTPGMLGYGIAKTGTHHLTQTMGACTGSNTSLVNKSLRQAGRKVRQNINTNVNRAAALDTLTVVSILPTKIDTPSNRQVEPNGDFASWTKPSDIANEICRWIQRPPLRPHSGSLIKVFPDKNGNGAVFEVAR